MDNKILDHFGFSCLPFSKALSPQQALETESFTEACSRLEYGIKGEDVLLLTGPVGVGKSVVLGAFIHAMDINSYTPLYIRGNGLGDGELYKAILAGLSHEPPRFTQPAKRMFYSIIPELTRKPVVLIDDAQDLKDSALVNLKAMTNFNHDSESRITFILCGQPELKARLKLIQFLPLMQRIRVFFHMKPMSLQETIRYIDHHTASAGNQNPLFSDSAKADIHRHTEGIARRVNTVCYRSLINAAIKDKKIIDSVDLFLEAPCDG